MKIHPQLSRPLTRIALPLLLVLGVLVLAYLLWSPGLDIHDGRNDLRANGIWLQHGWLGDIYGSNAIKKTRPSFAAPSELANSHISFPPTA